MPRSLSNSAGPMMPYRVVRSARRTMAIEVRAGGEVLLRAPFYVSDAEIDAFVSSRQDWLREHVRRMEQKPPRRAWSKEETQRLVALARERLPALVERYAAQVGVTPAGITITDARTRYGSCSSKGRLSFSCYLMDSPMEAVSFVVAHELCHLKHMNHGADFYALLDRTMPDWRERRKRLKPI